FQPDQLAELPILPIGEVETAYYLRLSVEDKPGVLADVTRILADHSISIDAMLQREPAEGADQADIIILTHRTFEKHMSAALEKITALSVVRGDVTRLRLEALG
ncbi:MAG: ACT domain-containing protein, partial [Aquaspirillum sp.]|nr:ACT domain-containing protein [Aquaspirillum sp.]